MERTKWKKRGGRRQKGEEEEETDKKKKKKKIEAKLEEVIKIEERKWEKDENSKRCEKLLMLVKKGVKRWKW